MVCNGVSKQARSGHLPTLHHSYTFERRFSNTTQDKAVRANLDGFEHTELQLMRAASTSWLTGTQSSTSDFHFQDASTVTTPPRTLLYTHLLKDRPRGAPSRMLPMLLAAPNMHCHKLVHTVTEVIDSSKPTCTSTNCRTLTKYADLGHTITVHCTVVHV